MPSQASPQNPDWTILSLLRWSTACFQDHHIDSPRATAEILLAYVLKARCIDLYLQSDRPVAAAELQAYQALVRRRLEREPVAYIIGVKEFWSTEFVVTKDVLIPRPETETLVEEALTWLAACPAGSSKRVLELGTGSGAIILSLAREQGRHVYLASDICANAIQVAKLNARRQGLENRVFFFCANWLAGLSPEKSGFDLIMSNPPYISTKDLRRLQPEIHAYEPSRALDGGSDGLACIREIMGTAWRFLSPGGVLMLEIGHDQRPAVQRILDGCAWQAEFHFKADLAGRDRVIWARRKKSVAGQELF
jgi:release factor glutamine methyltransferase